MFQRNIFSLDIGSQNTKIVIGKHQKNKLYIDRAIIVDTPLHCIEDGNIVDKLRLSQEIKNTLGINSIKTRDATCTTNSTTIINREITIPKAEDSELETMVNFEIQQYLPIIMEDYLIQYKVLETIQDDNFENSLNKLKVLVVVYPKHMAEGYFETLKAADLKPSVLDVNFNSINKLLKNDIEINGEKHTINKQLTPIDISGHSIGPINKDSINETVAFIDMGAENLSVNIYSNGQMNFSRMTTSGGNIIDKNIAREYDTTLEDAEKMKKQYCDLLEENNFKKMEQLNGIIKEDVNNWIEEINRILQFYKNKQVGNKVDKIFIHGGSSRLKGIEAYMSRALNVPVVRVKSMSNIILGKDVDKEQLDLYLNAIGAIIRL